MLSEMNAPPEDEFPSRSEIPNETAKIQRIFAVGMFRGEYERQIVIKPTVVTRAEPPRAKTVKSGLATPLMRRRTPRLSLQCLIFKRSARFESPLKNAVMTEAVDAYKIRYGCGSLQR